MFASEHFDLKADVVNIAKGIASGLPLGVTCARADVMTWPPGAHASTFGGNPVSCAAALAVLDTIADERLLDSVKRAGEHLADELSTVDSPLVREVRGTGLWRALALNGQHAVAVERNARERGLLVNAVKPDVIRLAPPLILTEADVDEAMPLLRTALGDAHA